ncbi:ketosynthase [Luteimonas sp. RD2P54]|uniref:Ketosynthase n=1 Tax=Luteimonas endophytica TaxID=3042023 RepID=A0ABT6JE83_9GAMM|nr:ketosynthase [Luteimonas endophytica]MDH5824503.1 ketosynthase [Luteimonas endophytica]
MLLILEIVLALGYALLAHLASAFDSEPLALGALVVLVLLVLAAPLAARRIGAWLALPLLLAGAWALFRAGHAPLPLLLVPVAFIGLIAWVFGRTLRPGRAPLIARIVAALDRVEPAQLPADLRAYTRGLTAAWALLLCALALVNLGLAMIATPDGLLAGLGVQPPWTITRTQWSWFANLFNYGIVGGFFFGEYLLRKRRFPGRYRSFVQFLRHLGGLGAGFWRDLMR